MAKTVNKPIKVGPAELVWLTVKGEGKNTAMPGQSERYQYVANIKTEEGSEVHKAAEAKIWEVWEEYKLKNGIKGKPAKNDKGEYMIGIHKDYIEDPTGEIDPDTEKVRKIPSGYVIISMKTGITWPDGSQKIVKILNNKGADITSAYHKVDWTIGNETVGVLHGVASANDIGGKHKVSLYLQAVQIVSNLVKYTPGKVDADAFDGEEITIDEDVNEDATNSATEGTTNTNTTDAPDV